MSLNLYESIYVRIVCDDPPTDLRALLGDERPDVSSGYGGWEEIARPHRKTVTTWAGMPARRLQVGIVMDNWTAGTSIEGDIRDLERLALPREGGQPPTVELRALGGVLPWRRGREWVVEAITWGDALMNQNGNRVRQAATVTFLEYVSDDLIERVSPSKKRRGKDARASGKGSKKGAKNKRHTVKRGESLRAIAKNELRDAKRWREIAKLNDIRDPRNIRVGQVIRLP